jgi:broad specificity phosphatase PhoE
MLYRSHEKSYLDHALIPDRHSKRAGLQTQEEESLKVFFVRHAESTANAFQDRSKDPPLSPRGVEQARSLEGSALTVICSPLRRARQTLFNCELRPCYHVVVSHLCREIRAGNPCDYLEDEDETVSETAEEIAERVRLLRELVLTIRKQYPEMTIAIVSHHCFIGHLTGVWPDNCQIVDWPIGD